MREKFNHLYLDSHERKLLMHAGLYTKGDTNMIVCRGLGNSIIPIRFNNRPEIVLLELIAE